MLSVAAVCHHVISSTVECRDGAVRLRIVAVRLSGVRVILMFN